MTSTAKTTQPADADEGPLDEAAIRAPFDANDPLTIGLEEEVLLLDPASHLPVPMGAEVVAAAADERVKRELPACQVELLTLPDHDVGRAIEELGRARATLLDVCGGGVAVAAAAVHPLVPAADVAATERHGEIASTYGEVARRQLVGALQVHVAVGSADGTLAVYNALRGYLPEIAALAASAPFYEGRDTGLASVRPVVSGQLPRQGVPPAIESWGRFAEDLRWGRTSGSVPEPRRWWWELRPHVVHGTLEVRVPDVQASMASTAAVVSTVHALVAYLRHQHDEGRPLGCPSTWRIAENRWSALRDGVHGELADLETGTSVATAHRLLQLLDLIEPHASISLDGARSLVARNGADALRAAGLSGATALLIEAFGADGGASVAS